MKYKPYNPPKSRLWQSKEKVKKALFAGASSSIVAGMLLVGSNTVFADTAADYSVPAYTQNTTPNGMHMMHRWNGASKVSGLASQLGLDPNTVRQELKSGKTVKQILQENGIVPGQLQKALTSRKAIKTWKNQKVSI